MDTINVFCWSLWPRGLMRRSAAARLLRMGVRIPPGEWMSVECVVLSGWGLCDELITRPEESYRLWCVVVCDLETSWMRRPWPSSGGGGGVGLKNKQKKTFWPSGESFGLAISVPPNHQNRLNMFPCSRSPALPVIHPLCSLYAVVIFTIACPRPWKPL